MSNWIPVDKASPEEEEDVLVCDEKGKMAVAFGYWHLAYKHRFVWITNEFVFGKVVAWMPLPEPYKEGEER